MIVERLSFQAKYGRGDELVALAREWNQRMMPAMREMGALGARIYTDATGPMFTMQLETEFSDWPAYGRFMAADQEMYGTPEFQEWFGRMTACTERGDRQVFNVETA